MVPPPYLSIYIYVYPPLPPRSRVQVLCVALWSLDDYWYYALFTLVMLVLFEAMLCFQRQKNLEMLRSMRREPTLVYALRAGRWQRVSSEAVTPGEVISLVARPPTVARAVQEMQRRAMMRTQYQQQQQRRRPGAGGTGRGRPDVGFPMGGGGGGASLGMDQVLSGGVGEVVGDDEALAPFDVLLMRGSCVVNEAMLTGESVPQAKTSLLSAGGGAGGEDAWVKVEDGTDSPHRKHVVFSGTKVGATACCTEVPVLVPLFFADNKTRDALRVPAVQLHHSHT